MKKWKRQTIKIVTVFALGVGISWGSFASSTSPMVIMASNINTIPKAQVAKNAYISAAKAQEIATTHAKVTVINLSDPNWSQTNLSETNVIVKKCKLDWENGIMVYEVEFFSSNYEYDYEINAITGEIVSHEKEVENHVLQIQALKNYATGNMGTTGNTGTSGIINNETATSAYIGKERAEAIAYTHAGLTKEGFYPGWCELEREDGIVIYEIEFQSLDGYDYEYEIHAVTGEILSSKKEQSTHFAAIQANQNGQVKDTITYIHQSEAEHEAIAHAGVTNYQIVNSKLDQEDGIIVYEIKFIADVYEYDYKIHAMTGEVVSYKKELSEIGKLNSQTASIQSNANTQNNTNPIQNNGSTTTFISEADARNIALQHAKATTGSFITDYELELKNKKGIFIYEIEFKFGGFEYEYKINATTGEIITYEREWDD